MINRWNDLLRELEEEESSDLEEEDILDSAQTLGLYTDADDEHPKEVGMGRYFNRVN